MKDGISKFLPFIVGGFIGWLLFNPPAWLAPRGPFRTPILIAAA